MVQGDPFSMLARMPPLSPVTYYIIKDFKHNLMQLNKVKKVTFKRHHRLEVKKDQVRKIMNEMTYHEK